MPLEEYQRKRDFRKTPEPAGGAVAPAPRRGPAGSSSSATARPACTTTSASRSTACSSPGPCRRARRSTRPQRRMAVHVEDHPIEYLDFEGVIPKGEYGGGDVIVWDWGTWTPESETPDGRRAVEDGELKFTLHGEKLRGRFTIVRTSGRGPRRGGASAAATTRTAASSGCSSTSATTTPVPAGTPRTIRRASRPAGRTTRSRPDRDAIWISHAPAATAEIDLSGREDAELPGFIPPMVATLADKALSRRRLAVRDQVGRLPRRGGRRATARRRSSPATATTPRRTSRGCSRRPTWIDAARGDRRRRGRRARRRRPARLQPPPGGDRRRLDPLRLPGVRPALPRRPVAARRPARGPQGSSSARSCATDDRRVRFADHVDRRGAGVPRGGEGAAASRGSIAKHRRSPYEPGDALEGLAQDQDPAGAGARRRRLDAGRGRRDATSGRSSSACSSDEDGTRSCGSRARSARASPRRRGSACSSGSTALAIDEPPFDPPPPKRLQGPLGRRPQARRLGAPGARHPRRARRLDARRPRPPGGVQGPRRGRQAADRGRPRARRRDERPTVETGEAADCPKPRTMARAEPTPKAKTVPLAATHEFRVGRDRGRARSARRDDQGRACGRSAASS